VGHDEFVEGDRGVTPRADDLDPDGVLAGVRPRPVEDRLPRGVPALIESHALHEHAVDEHPRPAETWSLWGVPGDPSPRECERCARISLRRDANGATGMGATG